jgi:hypothetical protein
LILPDDKFYIDKRSGCVYSNHVIDFETGKQFILEITAVDTHLAELIVDVIDLNDNSPTFDPSSDAQRGLRHRRKLAS